MPTPVLVSGPYHRVKSTVGGGLLAVSNETSATLDFLLEDERYWWRWTQNESNGAFGYAALPRAASAQNRGCVSLYIKIVGLPGSGEVRLVGIGTRESNDLAQFGIDSTGAARLVTSANSDPQTGPTLSINTVYRVELEYDRSTTTATARCRIYDDAGTQVGSEMVAAVAGTVASVVQDVVIQVYGSGLNSLGAVVLFRDIVFCQGAEYPVGPHVVEGKVVAAVGTHSLDATPSAHFYQHDGATETALTTSETTSYQRIDETPLDGGSDRVGVKAAGGSPQFADPVGNGAQTAWTNTWTNVDDAVRDPNDGDNATISSSTDEAAEDIVFGNTITYEAGATYQLKVRGAGGAKRAIDLQFSVNDGASFGSRSEIIGTNAAEAWVTVDITSLITGQTALDQMRARFICNSTAGGGGASAVSIDAVYVVKVPAVTQPADTRYAEYELEDSGNAEDPWGLTVYAALRNESGTAANVIRAKLAEGGSENDLLGALSVGTASLTYRSATRAAKPSGGAWTDATFDATKVRVGYTNDADPQPRLDALVVEIAFPLAAGPTTHTGSSSLSLTVARVTAGRLTARAASSLPLAAARTTVGRLTAKGASQLPLTVTVTSAGARSVQGASSLTLTVTTATAGVRTTFGSSQASMTAAVSTTGRVGARGASTLLATVTVTTAGTRTTYGSSSLPLTAGVVTAGVRSTTGASSLTLTAAASTTGRLTARSASSLTLAVSITTDGTAGSGPGSHTGRSSLTLTVQAATHGRVGAHGSSSLGATVTITTTGVRTTFGSSASALTVGIQTAGRLTARSSSSLQLTIGATTAARVGALSRSTLTEIVQITTNGIVGELVGAPVTPRTNLTLSGSRTGAQVAGRTSLTLAGGTTVTGLGDGETVATPTPGGTHG